MRILELKFRRTGRNNYSYYYGDCVFLVGGHLNVSLKGEVRESLLLEDVEYFSVKRSKRRGDHAEDKA